MIDIASGKGFVISQQIRLPSDEVHSAMGLGVMIGGGCSIFELTSISFNRRAGSRKLQLRVSIELL